MKRTTISALLKINRGTGVYLDSAATTQTPDSVVANILAHYGIMQANVHRSSHVPSANATREYENARQIIQLFIGAHSLEEIVFTKGTTEAINMISQSFRSKLMPGDEIVLSVAEHHSNLIPWQLLAKQTRAVLKFVSLNSDQSLNMSSLNSLMSNKTKIVSIAHASNVIGIYNPVREIIRCAKTVGATVVLDSAQTVGHTPINVQDLQPDFLVASGHKMCGPTGVGFLYGKLDLLNSMSPMLGGGTMVEKVSLTDCTFAQSPYRHEAGTPPIAGAIALGAACEFLSGIGMSNIHSHCDQLSTYLYQQLTGSAIANELTIYGPPPPPSQEARINSPPGLHYSSRNGIVSFTHKRHHPHDLASLLSEQGVYVRAGQHCAQPLHEALGAPAGSVRASVQLYNDSHDVDEFVRKLCECVDILDEM